MTIAHRASTTGESSSTAGVTNAVPAGSAIDDILVWRYSGTTSSPDSAGLIGWTNLFRFSANGDYLQVHYRFVDGTETPTYTAPANTGGGRSLGIMSAFSGVDTVVPWDVATPTPLDDPTGAVFISPSITPVTNNAWILSFPHQVANAGITNSVLSSSTLDAIEAQASSTNGLNSNSVGAIAHEIWTTGEGAVTPAWTSNNVSIRTAVGIAALRPKGAPPAGGTMTFIKTVTVG